MMFRVKFNQGIGKALGSISRKETSPERMQWNTLDYS